VRKEGSGRDLCSISLCGSVAGLPRVSDGFLTSVFHVLRSSWTLDYDHLDALCAFDGLSVGGLLKGGWAVVGRVEGSLRGRHVVRG
jgi:hypothetical protein